MIPKEKQNAIRVRLGELEAANNGRLTPLNVVLDAANPASPMHDYFEWDDEKAAQAHRIEQARTLITSIRVVHRVEAAVVRTVNYVRDPTAAGGEQGYVSVATLRNDSDMAREALVAEFSRVADVLRRARELAAVLGAKDEVEELLTRVVGLRERFLAPAVVQ